MIKIITIYYYSIVEINYIISANIYKKFIFRE